MMIINNWLTWIEFEQDQKKNWNDTETINQANRQMFPSIALTVASDCVLFIYVTQYYQPLLANQIC